VGLGLRFGYDATSRRESTKSEALFPLTRGSSRVSRRRHLSARHAPRLLDLRSARFLRDARTGGVAGSTPRSVAPARTRSGARGWRGARSCGFARRSGERARSRRVLGRAVDPSRGIALGHSAEDRSRRPFGFADVVRLPLGRDAEGVRPRPRVFHVRRTGRRRRGAQRGRPGRLEGPERPPRGPARTPPTAPSLVASDRSTTDGTPTAVVPRGSGGFPGVEPARVEPKSLPRGALDVPPADPASNPPRRTLPTPPRPPPRSFPRTSRAATSRARAW